MRKSFQQRHPQVIAGLLPEPAIGVLGLRRLQRSNVDEREIWLTEARKVCKHGRKVTGWGNIKVT